MSEFDPAAELEHARRMADAIRASEFMPAYRKPASLAETVANIRACSLSPEDAAEVRRWAESKMEPWQRVLYCRPRLRLVVDNG